MKLEIFVKIPIFYIIFFVSLVTSVYAEETTSEEYIIKKGDTLWDISDFKLRDPLLWPELWKKNPKIKNPDLIYPGDKIKLPSKEKSMPLPIALPKEVPSVLEPELILPKIESIIEILKEKPVRYIINKNSYISSGWISEKFVSIGEITNAERGRTIFGKNDVVYLKINEGVASGNKFFIIRDVKIVKHPKTGKRLGHQIRITGILKTIGIGNNLPKAKIETAFDKIQIGDGLIPYYEVEPPVIPNVVRTPDIQGYVVETHMNTQTTSAGNIIYLDKGQNDGLEVGNTFSVFSEATIGTIQILLLQPTTSTAVVLENTYEIRIGDTWGKK